MDPWKRLYGRCIMASHYCSSFQSYLSHKTTTVSLLLNQMLPSWTSEILQIQDGSAWGTNRRANGESCSTPVSVICFVCGHKALGTLALLEGGQVLSYAGHNYNTWETSWKEASIAAYRDLFHVHKTIYIRSKGPLLWSRNHLFLLSANCLYFCCM